MAAGLDSLVLGEAEILGQVRDAHAAAGDAAGLSLGLLFRTAISAGRRARSETAIGANPATASSMALALADGVLGDIRERRALVVGAGRIGLQTLKAVTGRGIGAIAVANRTPERAAEAAERFGGKGYGLDELEEALAWADFAVTATGSEEPVLRAELVSAAISRRPERPLVLVDLAVPADVERTVADIDGARLFDVDDLRAGLDGALASRLAEVPKSKRSSKTRSPASVGATGSSRSSRSSPRSGCRRRRSVSKRSSGRCDGSARSIPRLPHSSSSSRAAS